jgi:hypothetical protein
MDKNYFIRALEALARFSLNIVRLQDNLPANGNLRD